jgi:hypothetical protein
MKIVCALIVLSLWPLSAQDVKFPESFEKLAAKAKETVNISLDGSMLRLAGNFLSGRKTDEATVKRLTDGLRGLYVRVFEFGEDGQYADADVAPVRSQLAGAKGWSKIVDVAQNHERTEVYAKSEADKIAGMAVIAAERRQLTVVYVDGPIDLKQLSQLAGLDIDVPVAKSPTK